MHPIIVKPKFIKIHIKIRFQKMNEKGAICIKEQIFRFRNNLNKCKSQDDKKVPIS